MGPPHSFRLAHDIQPELCLAHAQDLQGMGYGIVATAGTKAALEAGGMADVEAVLKIQEGRPNAGDLMVNKDITMLMITTTGAGPARPVCTCTALKALCVTLFATRAEGCSA